MAIDVLNEVREAEAKAKAKVQQATLTADQRLKDAAVRVDEMITAARKGAEAEAASLMANAQESANQEIASAKAGLAQERSVLQHKAEANMDKAVSFIIERIVTARGRR